MNKSHNCKSCGQLMNVYRRAIRKNMIPGLLALADREPKKTTELGLDDGARSDFTTLRYWGLICSAEDSKWILTEKGRQFIHGNISVPKYLFIFNSQIEARSEEQIYMQDIEPKQFTKEELMNNATSKNEFNPEDVE